MTYVELEYKFTPVGKRKPVTKCSQHDISDDLWFALQKCAETDDYCSVGKWDWNQGRLYMTRGGGVDDVFKEYCNAPADYKLFDIIKRTINFELDEMKYKYEYTVEVLEVDLKKKRAYIKHFPTNKMIERGEYETKEYWVNISDRCVYEEIKPKDTVLIRKFLDDSFLAVQVFESYKELSEEEKKQQRKDLENLIGGY